MSRSRAPKPSPLKVPRAHRRQMWQMKDFGVGDGTHDVPQKTARLMRAGLLLLGAVFTS